MVYPITKRILWPIFALFVKRIDGFENIPNEQCIFVANHESYIDGPLILLMLAWHKNIKVYTFATNVKFTGAIWDFLFEHFGAIRIGGSMEKAFKKLDQGYSLSLWPEGARSESEKLLPTKHTGLGVIALKRKIPVVPIGLDTFHFWPRGQKLWNWKRCMVITIGKPMRFSGRFSKPAALKVVHTSMKEVSKLARISHAKAAA